jgi:hypothetical protein
MVKFPLDSQVTRQLSIEYNRQNCQASLMTCEQVATGREGAKTLLGWTLMLNNVLRFRGRALPRKSKTHEDSRPESYCTLM